MLPKRIEKAFLILGPGRALGTMLESAGLKRLNREDINSWQGFLEFTRKGWHPEYMVLWGFIDFWPKAKAWAKLHDVKVAHGELGWFPHYDSFGLDAQGFCWESSVVTAPDVGGAKNIPRLPEATPKNMPFPPEIKPPYALWAGQMVSDKVNVMGANAQDWCRHVSHFRAILPQHIQLVVRPHPSIKNRPSQEFAPHRKLEQTVLHLPNTIMTSDGDLNDLIAGSTCVAGANSTVITEAALLHQKPSFAYAKSWFSGYPDVVVPLSLERKEPLALVELSKTPSLGGSSRLLLHFQTRQIPRTPAPDKHRVMDWLERNCAVPDKNIPKLAHFIWLGDDPLPETYARCLWEFKELNPDLPTVLWECVPEEVPQSIKDMVDQCEYPQQKSDILRVWLLIQYGGIYFDVDIVWARPLPASMFQRGAFCGSNHRTPYENTQLGSVPGCPEMRAYLEAIQDYQDVKHQACYGPQLLRSLIETRKISMRKLPWWWFNVARCEKQQYMKFLGTPLADRKKIPGPSRFFAPDYDGQLPVGQHLHGSVNDQYLPSNR